MSQAQPRNAQGSRTHPGKPPLVKAPSGNAACASPARVAGAAGTDDAAGRRRLGRWLGRLIDIGCGLLCRMSAMGQSPRHDGTDPSEAELDLVWALVSRAVRWTWTLQARLKAAAAAAKGGPLERDRIERDRDEMRAVRRELQMAYAAWDEIPDRERRRRKRKRPIEPGLEGTPTTEIVMQICLDLHEAARLLNSAEMAGRIGTIATAALAMLGVPADGWEPETPASALRCHVPPDPAPAAPDPAESDPAWPAGRVDAPRLAPPGSG